MKTASLKCFSFLFAVLVVGAITNQATGQNAPKYLKYCSLFDPSYDGRTVSSSALMYHSTVSRVDGDDEFFYSPECNTPDYFAIPEGNSEIWSKWSTFFDDLPAEKDLILEIKFEGKADVETASLFGSLDGWARAQIKLSKILSIKNVTSLRIAVQPNYKASKPNIERIIDLRITADLFIESLLNPHRTNPDLVSVLPKEFLFVDSQGKVYNKDSYLSLNAPWLAELTPARQIVTTRQLLSKTGEKMVWRGSLNFTLPDAAEKTIVCDITFKLLNGEWIPIRASMLGP